MFKRVGPSLHVYGFHWNQSLLLWPVNLVLSWGFISHPFPFLFFSPSPHLPLPPLLPAPFFLLFLQYWTQNPGFRTVGKHSTTELHAQFLSSSLFCFGWNSGLCAFQANTLALSYISRSLLRILGRCPTIKPCPHRLISLGRYSTPEPRP